MMETKESSDCLLGGVDVHAVGIARLAEVRADILNLVEELLDGLLEDLLGLQCSRRLN